MRIVGMAAAVVVGLAFASTFNGLTAEAATITQTLAFTASGFKAYSGSAVPRDPIKGNFTFTLDNTKSVTDISKGLSFHSLNMSTVKPIVFSYDSQTKLLTVGANAHASQYIWGTNDFTLSIFLGPQPSGAFFGYSLAGHNDSYETYNVNVSAQGSAARTAAISSTPLPGSIVLLLTSLAVPASVGWMRIRNKGARA